MLTIPSHEGLSFHLPYSWMCCSGFATICVSSELQLHVHTSCCFISGDTLTWCINKSEGDYTRWNINKNASFPFLPYLWWFFASIQTREVTLWAAADAASFWALVFLLWSPGWLLHSFWSLCVLQAQFHAQPLAQHMMDSLKPLSDQERVPLVPLLIWNNVPDPRMDIWQMPFQRIWE